LALATTIVASDSLNITNNAPVLAAVKRIQELKQIERAAVVAEKERKALEADILAPLFDSTGASALVVRGVTAVKRSDVITRVNIDGKALLEAFPEAYAATKKESTSRRYNYS